MFYYVTINQKRAYKVEIPNFSETSDAVSTEGESEQIRLNELQPGFLFAFINQHPFDIHYKRSGNRFTCTIEGKEYEVLIEDEITYAVRQMAQKSEVKKEQVELTSPLTGNVIKVFKEPGETVEKGEVLILIESMKMENNIIAPQSGVIAKIDVKVGETVHTGQRLLLLSDQKANAQN